MESLFEKRLFFVAINLRPTEAQFVDYKKRSLKKDWNGELDWLLEKTTFSSSQ